MVESGTSSPLALLQRALTPPVPLVSSCQVQVLLDSMLGLVDLDVDLLLRVGELAHVPVRSGREGEVLAVDAKFGAHSLLDAEIPGMNVGEKKSVVIEPDLAYGPVNPEAKQSVPRGDIPAEIPLEVGLLHDLLGTGFRIQKPLQ